MFSLEEAKMQVHKFLVLVLILGMATGAMADGGVAFQDIAAGDGVGIDYRRAESPSDALFDALNSLW
jgi:hypothetical protein